ncbi:MAG: O-antigen ligase family protein [Cyanobacteria bacterium P01_C01_bin.72]
MNQATTGNNPAKKSWQSFFEPKPAWQAILSLVLTIFILLFTIPQLLIPLFPLGSLAVGIFLYRRYPILYVGFTWWIWFLGIFVRRLIDFHCGFITPWPYALTPLLVTSITFATVVRYLPRIYQKQGLPFFLCLFAVFYAFIIGLIQQQVTDYDREIIILLTWLSPICFGFHLFVNWQDYPLYRQIIQRSFFWGVIFMGIYGVLQFLLAPGWDRFFLVNSSQFNSVTNSSYMGSPKPLGIRVWSTMGNPMTFAFNLMPGLILLFISKNSWRYPANALGYLVFLLSQVRTAWYSWLITVALFVVSLKERYQIRAIITIVFLVLIMAPLATVEPFSGVISSRIETFVNLGNDGSLQSRLGQLEQASSIAASEFIGWGLVAPGQSPNGSFSTNDNGYLGILITFGWFGTLVYMSGILLLIAKVLLSKNLDIFAIASRAIAIGSLARMATSNVTTEQYAMPIWCFLAMAVASHQYYGYQKSQSLSPSK